LEENAGRAEKFTTRAELLDEFGWNLELTYVEPTLQGTFRGVRKCLSQVQEADVINSVSNPPHLQVVGLVAAKLTNTPWLAEFRDPLVQNPDVDSESIAGRGRSVLESLILKYADHVVWYDGIQIPKNYFRQTYPDVPETRYEMLPPIGFERAVFEGAETRSFGPFTITYAGSFYDGWIEPYTFLDGLSAYVDEPLSPSVQALFFGDWAPEYDKAVDQRNLEAVVDPRPFVPHEEIVSVLKGSDALLYIGGDDPRNKRNLPTKLYDYLGAKRLIIAIVDPSFRVAELIRELGVGIVVEPGDAVGVSDALRQIQDGQFVYDPEETIKEFTRRRSTEAYVEVLEKIR
jgi:glycosyltransferase involved in cell wall biosynthesis